MIEDYEHIKYYVLALFIVWLFVVVLFVRTCKKGDEQTLKELEHDHNENKTVFFLDDNPLQWEDVDFQRGLEPTVDSFKSLN